MIPLAQLIFTLAWSYAVMVFVLCFGEGFVFQIYLLVFVNIVHCLAPMSPHSLQK